MRCDYNAVDFGSYLRPRFPIKNWFARVRTFPNFSWFSDLITRLSSEAKETGPAVATWNWCYGPNRSRGVSTNRNRTVPPNCSTYMVPFAKLLGCPAPIHGSRKNLRDPPKRHAGKLREINIKNLRDPGLGVFQILRNTRAVIYPWVINLK